MPWGKTTTNSNLVTEMDVGIDSFCITLIASVLPWLLIKGAKMTSRHAWKLRIDRPLPLYPPCNTQ